MVVVAEAVAVAVVVVMTVLVVIEELIASLFCSTYLF